MTQHTDKQQFGFDALLSDAEADNRARRFERATAHLPGTMEAALPYYRNLIDRNHTAMLAAEADESRAIHEEARRLARKLNNSDPGILAGDDAPGYVLARKTGAVPGNVPNWGQEGSFRIEAARMEVQIDMEGLFGIGSGFGFWPGFSARAVHPDRPFLSETGYRSFLGIHADPVAGHTPDSFAAMVIETYVATERNGKLVRIVERWR